MRLIRKSRAAGRPRFIISKDVAGGAFLKVVPLGGDPVAYIEQEIQDGVIERIEARCRATGAGTQPKVGKGIPLSDPIYDAAAE